jgi:hypothetical protein
MATAAPGDLPVEQRAALAAAAVLELVDEFGAGARSHERYPGGAVSVVDRVLSEILTRCSSHAAR